MRRRTPAPTRLPHFDSIMLSVTQGIANALPGGATAATVRAASSAHVAHMRALFAHAYDALYNLLKHHAFWSAQNSVVLQELFTRALPWALRSPPIAKSLGRLFELIAAKENIYYWEKGTPPLVCEFVSLLAARITAERVDEARRALLPGVCALVNALHADYRWRINLALSDREKPIFAEINQARKDQFNYQE